METRATRIGLWAWGVLIVAFLWIPLAIMALYAFNSSNIQSWPIPGFTTKWFSEAWNDDEVRTALWLSLRAGLFATAVALVLGSLAAFGLSRSRFFGRDAVSFVFVLPIALPGIITGLALNSFFEASADLGAHGWQTFCYVTFPVVRTAIIAGGLLAFALSWDEIVVTYFTAGSQNTLPLIIFGKIRQGTELPIVNAIALFVIVLTIIPVFIAQRLTTGGETERTTAAR